MTETTLITKPETFAAPVELGVADELISGLSKRLSGAKADTVEGYKIVRGGLAECRTLKRQVTDAHKELKASALSWGQACDAEKRRVIDLIIDVAKPLQAEKDRVDNEKERVKQAKLDAERKAEEAKQEALRKAREAIERAETERLRKEQEADAAIERAEVERLRKEQEAKDAAVRKQQEAQAERLEEQRQQLISDRADARREQQEEEKRIDDRRRLLAVEAEALAQKQRKLEAEERKEADRKQKMIDDFNASKQRVIDEEAAAALIEECKPDIVRLRELATALGEYNLPDLKTAWADRIVDDVDKSLKAITHDIEAACDMLDI